MQSAAQQNMSHSLALGECNEKIDSLQADLIEARMDVRNGDLHYAYVIYDNIFHLNCIYLLFSAMFDSREHFRHLYNASERKLFELNLYVPLF